MRAKYPKFIIHHNKRLGFGFMYLALEKFIDAELLICLLK
jgi:hypothetical protein